jgi:hypothetical protein
MELSPEERQRIYAEEKARLEAQQTLKAGKKGLSLRPGCVVALIVGLGALIILAALSRHMPPAELDKPAKIAQPGRDDATAIRMAHEFIKRRLKAPATAEFGGEKVSFSPPTKHLVTGYVDAQNAFGAKLRKQWACVVEKSGADEWSSSDPCLLFE